MDLRFFYPGSSRSLFAPLIQILRTNETHKAHPVVHPRPYVRPSRATAYREDLTSPVY